MDWLDETSYSRCDKDRVPTTFAARCGPMKLVVTSSEDAQAELVRLAREWVMAAVTGLSSAN